MARAGWKGDLGLGALPLDSSVTEEGGEGGVGVGF